MYLYKYKEKINIYCTYVIYIYEHKCLHLGERDTQTRNKDWCGGGKHPYPHPVGGQDPLSHGTDSCPWYDIHPSCIKESLLLCDVCNDQ